MGAILKPSDTGRLDLPADICKAVGLEEGGDVSVWVERGEIRVGPAREVMTSLQKEAGDIFRGTNESVAAFIGDRRREAADRSGR